MDNSGDVGRGNSDDGVGAASSRLKVAAQDRGVHPVSPSYGLFLRESYRALDVETDATPGGLRFSKNGKSSFCIELKMQLQLRARILSKRLVPDVAFAQRRDRISR